MASQKLADQKPLKVSEPPARWLAGYYPELASIEAHCYFHGPDVILEAHCYFHGPAVILDAHCFCCGPDVITDI